MKIKKLIKKLEKLEKKHGNLQVRIETHDDGLKILEHVNTEFVPTEVIDECYFDDYIPEDVNTESSYYTRVVSIS